MRVVMTLLARNEADIVDAQIAFHLNAGVDFVIATDHGSTDGTREILESYAREGCLYLTGELGEDFHQAEWVTRMARMAATDFGADWVVNTDADEFWWPREAPLKAILAEIPPRFGTIRGVLRNFVPTTGEESRPFFERMTMRVAPRELVVTSPFRVQEKVVHRAHPDVTVPLGNHDVLADGLVDLRGWYPIEILHFPIRSLQQCERKLGSHVARAIREPGLGHMTSLREGHAALRAGTVREYYESLAVDESRLRAGLADGSLVVDTRLRDVLRELGLADDGDAAKEREFQRRPLRSHVVPLAMPTLEGDGRFAGEITVGAEWESTVKIQARIDELQERVRGLEGGVWAGIRRRRRLRVATSTGGRTG